MMRITKILLALFFASTLILSISCSKKTDDTYKLEYKIESFDEFCIEVSYKNTDGEFVITSEPADFPGGIKTLPIAKPFIGAFELKVNNLSINNRSYELSIVIDGEPKLSKTMIVPPFVAKSEYLEYNLR